MSSESGFLQYLQECFSEYAKNDAVEVVSLATTDGFPVHTYTKPGHALEQDSLSAAASTLHSVSNAVARQILGKSFRVAFIEAEQGNVAFVAIDINHANYVLVMSANQSMNIASLRLLITRLGSEIKQYCHQSKTASSKANVQ